MMSQKGFTRTGLALIVAGSVVVLAVIGLKVFSTYFAIDSGENGPTPDVVTVSKIYYVNPCSSSANDQSTGDSWTHPFKTITAAVDSVPKDSPVNTQTQIWLIKTDSNCPAIHESISIEQKNRISFYGGFTGREDQINQRSLDDSTTINGDGQITARISNATSVGFDRLTLTNGQNIAEVAKKLNFKDVTVSESRKSASDADSGGSGLKLTSSDVKLNNVIFKNCSTTGSGGAIEGLKSDIDGEKMTFLNNQAANYGGALKADQGRVTIKKTIFQNNQSGKDLTNQGGGAIFAKNISVESLISQSFFYKNTAGNGAAILVDQSTPEISNNIFSANVSTEGTMSMVDQSGTKLYNNTFVYNTASKGSSAIFIGSQTNPIISNNLFAFNNGTLGVISHDQTVSLSNVNYLAYWKNIGELFQNKTDLSSCQNCSELSPGFTGTDVANPNSFILTPDSQLLGRGKDLTTIIDDYFGTPRPTGDNDIGAIQLKQ